MHVLTATEVSDWLKNLGNRGNEYVRYDAGELFFMHPEAACISLEYPQKLERLPFFARCLATIGYDTTDFNGALIWFTTWGVWNPADEGVGYRIVEGMRHAAGQNQSFEAAPGHSFRADERLEAVGMLLQPMIFGWDSFYLPRWSYGTDEFIVHVSHDSFVTVVTRTRAFHDPIFRQLGELGLDPQPGHNIQTTRFCRRTL